MKKVLFCLFIISLSLFWACTPKSVVNESELSSTESVEKEESKTVPIEIVYLEGFATLIHEGESLEAETGLFLETGDSLKVENDSYCEIQVGQISQVSLEGGTILSVDRNLYAGTSTQARLNLEEGSILCKVQKLTGEDRFQVKTESTTCGVRGTEFMVSADKESGETHLAVVEGSVALTPSDVDWDDIKDNALEKNESLQTSLDKMEEAFPVVQAGEEIRIEKEQMNPLAEELKKTEILLQENPEEIGAELEAQISEIRRQNEPLRRKPLGEESLQKARELRSRPETSNRPQVAVIEEEMDNPVIIKEEKDVQEVQPVTPETPPANTIRGLKNIPVDHPNLYFMGRIFNGSEGPTYNYPAVTFRMRFRGSRRLAVQIKNYNPNPHEPFQTYYFVSIDGEAPQRIAIDPKKEVYVLSTRLDAGEHQVDLIRNQYSSNDVFKGFLLEEQAEVLSAEQPELLIEFIGDSFTAGYGNELSVNAEVQNKNPDPYHYSTSNSNVYQSWGLIAARELNSAYRLIARHGTGMTRNYDESALTIPRIYRRALLDDSSTILEHPEQDPPDLLVICVGKDDFGEGLNIENGEYRDMRRNFEKNYSDFLEELRGYYPEAPFIITVGPQISNGWPEGYDARTSLTQDLLSVQALRRKLGDENIHLMILDEKSDPLGADYHPAMHDHEKAAEELLRFIKKNQLLD